MKLFFVLLHFLLCFNVLTYAQSFKMFEVKPFESFEHKSLGTQYDIAIEKIIAKDHVSLENPLSATVVVRNNGIQTINSFDISYSVGSEKKSLNIESVSIPGGALYYVDLPEINIDKVGNNQLNVSVSNVNNKKDDVNPDNNIIRKDFYCWENTFHKKVLFEFFTNVACTWCPQGHDHAETQIEQSGYADDIIWVNHHSGMNGDPEKDGDIFTIPEDLEYSQLFKVQGNPNCIIDRTPVFGELVLHPLLLSSEDFVDKVESPALASVIIDGTYDNDTRDLALKISGEVVGDIPNPTLHVYLIQSNYRHVQAGVNGDYIHNNFMRKVLTDPMGSPISLSDNKYEETFNFTIPEKIEELDAIPGDMSVVAFISNYDESDVKNNTVYNAEKIDLKDWGAEVSISEHTIQSPTIQVIDNSIVVVDDYSKLSVYDIAGREIVNRNLPKGIYIVRITLLDGKQVIQKVTV